MNILKYHTEKRFLKLPRVKDQKKEGLLTKGQQQTQTLYFHFMF